MKLMGSLLALVLVSGLVVVTQGADKGDKSDKTARPLDKDFLIKAATCNNKEIQVSKVAMERSPTPQVKEYAAMLVKEHTQAGDRLADLLKDLKLAIATGFDKETKDEVARLNKLDGKEFDRAYLQCMVTGHQEAIATCENQVKNGQDAAIRKFAEECIPHLRHHLKRAQELSQAAPK